MARWTLFILLWYAVSVLAHTSDVCLVRVVQLAERLKQCQVEQIERGQCEDTERALEVQMSQCRVAAFTSKDVEKAKIHGFDQVQGKVTLSPYRKDLQQQQWENRLMNPNLNTFKQFFPESDHVLDELREHFHTQACPKQYQGVLERYVFSGDLPLRRFPDHMAIQAEGSSEVIRALFFRQEEAGRCYPVPSSAQPQVYKLVNLPRYWVMALQKQPKYRVVYCGRKDCQYEQEQVMLLYQRYQKSYREHRNLIMCAEIDAKNVRRGTIKGKSRSTIKFPEYCPKQEIQTKALNAKGELEQLEQALFQGVTVRIPNVKQE